MSVEGLTAAAKTQGGKGKTRMLNAQSLYQIPLYTLTTHQTSLLVGIAATLRMALPSHLAVESTIHVANTTVIGAHTALPVSTSPCLSAVLESDRLAVRASNQHIERIGKLAVNVFVIAAREAEQRDTTHGVLRRIIEAHVEAIFGIASVGAHGTLVFLVLRDVYAAPAGDNTLINCGEIGV